MKENNETIRDFNSVSPSARWILLMKGHTSIPFAREAATLIELPGLFTPNFENPDLGYWGRTIHFESRYYSINQLLADHPVKNILELSSGFSFRGLEMTQRDPVYYIDTDLPAMIAQKTELIAKLGANLAAPKGKLELQALNVLDENRFRDLVSHFPPGELAIVNEGLLMYLNPDEKKKLCKIILDVLKQRGGYWITADIYLNLTHRGINLGLDQATQKFFDEHNVEENKFESFQAAAEFFDSMGFAVDKEAEFNYGVMSSFQYLLSNARQEDLERMSKMEKINTTWRLRPKE